MYEYRPIQVHKNGAISDEAPTNAIGVFDNSSLSAVYIHDPTRQDKLRAQIFFYVSMISGLALLLAFAPKLSALFAIPLVLIYLALGALLMWSVLIPDTTPTKDAELLKSAIKLTHGTDIAIIKSRTQLLRDYPTDQGNPLL